MGEPELVGAEGLVLALRAAGLALQRFLTAQAHAAAGDGVGSSLAVHAGSA